MTFFRFLTIVVASALCAECFRVVKRSPSSQNSQTCGVQSEGGSFDENALVSKYADDPMDQLIGDGLLDDDSMESRIVNGEKPSHRWPWMASIVQGGHICGGSVIDRTHVLTAAHCFQDGTDHPEEFTILVGELVQGEFGKAYPVASVRVHEEYDPAPNWFNDIALVTLGEPLPEDAVPVCLPQVDDIQEGDTLTAIGFGAKEEGGRASVELQEVRDLPVIGTEVCASLIHAGVTDHQVCTADATQERGTCQGDSGGPVMQERNGQWTLIGLVSFSVGCARPGVPTVHTRVTAYRSWIDHAIAG